MSQVAIAAAKERLKTRGLEPDTLYEDEFRTLLHREVRWQVEWARGQMLPSAPPALMACAGESAVEFYAIQQKRAAPTPAS